MFAQCSPESSNASVKTKSVYKEFMDASFETNVGVGKDAKIRTGSYQKRTAFGNKKPGWENSWDDAFSDPQEASVQGPDDPVMKSLHLALVDAFLSGLEVNTY